MGSIYVQYYYAIPTSIGQMRLIRGLYSGTLAELAAESNNRIPVNEEDEIECSVATARNTSNWPMGSDTYNAHSIHEGASGVVATIPDSDIVIWDNNGTIQFRSNIGGTYLMGGNVGYISGTDAQVSLPIVIKTTDNRYVVSTVWITTTGFTLDDFIYIGAATATILPSSGKFGYFVGPANIVHTITETSSRIYDVKPAASGLLNDTGAYSVVDAYFAAISPVTPSKDPYAPGGISSPGGGDGDFDFTSTNIPVPALPNIGAYDTGFISLYMPSAMQLKSLAAYMWSGAFDPDNLKKIVANPMDAILGLHIVPRTQLHPVASSATLYVGNINTELSMPLLTEQYYSLNCGTINISPKWGAYLDYSPYSKLSLYLPYIGFVPLSPDDCMNGSIRVEYHVDVLSGSCCAFVYCYSNQGADGHTLYTFTGSCACDCPVTEGQYTNGLFGSIKAGAALASGIMGGTGGIMAGIEEAANAAISMVKPDISRSGSFGGSAGLMGIQYPYLVLTVPKMCTPSDQYKYRGYPSFITVDLEEVAGYAQVEITHLAGMSCTDTEAKEIMTLLEGGVIF